MKDKYRAYSQTPSFYEYTDASGKTVREVYYYRPVEKDDQTKISITTMKARTHDQAIRDIAGKPLSQIDDAYFKETFGTFYKGVESFRGTIPIMQMQDDFDASSVEEFFFSFCEQAHLFELYVDHKKLKGIPHRINSILRLNEPLRGVVNNVEWIPASLWRKAMRDYVKDHDLADIRAMLLEMVSITGDL